MFIFICAIPIDAYGQEIPLIDLSCEVDPAHLTRIVELDYFGRLSAGRTRERNIRMHFDEVITSIKESDLVTLEPAGRFRLGTDCVDGVCASWRAIDSPQENLAVYARLLRYGHIPTDPLEEDVDFHGDPESRRPTRAIRIGR